MEEYIKSYGLVNKKTIYRFTLSSDVNYAEIFEKSFPTTPIKGVKICLVSDTQQDLRMVAPIVIKNTETSSDNIFIIDLKGEYIGNYYFAGLIVDNMTEFELFFSDLKAGKVSLGIINIDKTATPATIGRIVEQLVPICGTCEHAATYIFVSDELTIKHINEGMAEYFIKVKGDLVNSKETDKQ